MGALINAQQLERVTSFNEQVDLRTQKQKYLVEPSYQSPAIL